MPTPSNVTLGLANAFTPAPVNVTSILPNDISGLTNTFGLTPLIYQESITPHPANAIGSLPLMHQETITLHLANALGLTPPICQPTIISRPA